jgi:tetrahydromethanopterin S-methyltransferase subunit G
MEEKEKIEKIINNKIIDFYKSEKFKELLKQEYLIGLKIGLIFGLSMGMVIVLILNVFI